MPQSASTTSDAREIRELPPPLDYQPEGLPAIPGGWTEREWIVEGRSFRLMLPALPDAFLDDAAVHAAFDRDEYMPYWAFLWPAALKMSAMVLKTKWPRNAKVLEIGSGIGFVSLAGLSLGLNVTITDYESKAVELALFNARRNGFTHGEGFTLDWRTPPDRQYPFLWGCDLLYEDRNSEPLLNLTRQVLSRDGVAWFVDAGRIPAERFCTLLSQYGLMFQLFDEHRNPLPAPRLGQFQLIEVRHQCQA